MNTVWIFIGQFLWKKVPQIKVNRSSFPWIHIFRRKETKCCRMLRTVMRSKLPLATWWWWFSDYFFDWTYKKSRFLDILIEILFIWWVPSTSEDSNWSYIRKTGVQIKHISQGDERITKTFDKHLSFSIAFVDQTKAAAESRIFLASILIMTLWRINFPYILRTFHQYAAHFYQEAWKRQPKTLLWT